MAADASTDQEVTYFIYRAKDGKHGQGYGPAQNLRDMHNGLPRLLQLYPYNNNVGNTTIDIVAVHGIETCSPKTWISYERDIEPRGRKVHWLLDEDMLPRQIPQARIWAYDYNSNCYSDNAQQVDIPGLGEIFLRVLYEARSKGVGSRTLIFIGSCFGGVVGLEKASRNPRYTDILRSTAGVVFLGTPLRETRLASIAEWIALLRELMHRETSETLLQGLRENANSLNNMVYNFAMMTIEKNLQIRCSYETRKTQVANFASRTIAKAFGIPKVEFVPRESACLDCHQRFALDVRHAMMNKFRGPEDVNFKIVADSLKEFADNAHLTRARTATEMKFLECLASNYRDDKNRNRQRVPDPGCGKSVLSRTLVNEGLLSNDTRTATICYFFFKDDDIRRQIETHVLCALLHQLFTQKPALLKYGMSRFENHGEKLSVNASELWDTFNTAARDPGAGNIVCVLDAFDECKKESVRNIISQLSRLYIDRNLGKTAVKFLVTSRPYSYIETYFNREIKNMTSISLKDEEESEEISSEINLVIHDEIPKLARARKPPLNSKAQASLMKCLTTIPHRTYLWLHLILVEIEEDLSSTPTGIKKIISSMPRSIEEAYEKILARIEKKSFAIQARRLLHIVLGAERPLTLAEMNIAMAIDDEILESGCCETNEALSLESEDAFETKARNICGLFVSIVESRIYLIHQTAKEFLVQTQPNNIPHPPGWKYSFDLVESNTIILEIWIAYILSEELAQPIPEKSMASLRVKEQQERYKGGGSADVPPLYSLLIYGAQYWSLHFQKAKPSLAQSMVQSVLKVCDTRTINCKNWYMFNASWLNGSLTAFAVAANLGLDTIIELLLEQEAIDLNFKSSSGQTPLSFAAARGHLEVVRLLVAQEGIDLNSIDNHFRTPLCHAAEGGHVEVVRLLLAQKGVDPNHKAKSDKTSLFMAASKGHVGVVRLLLAQKGIELNSKNRLGETPFCIAVSEGHVGVVRLLLERHAVEKNNHDCNYRTPFLLAVMEEHQKIVKLLLKEKDIDPNQWCDDFNPLLPAVDTKEDKELEKLLLADDRVKPLYDDSKLRPFYYALKERRKYILAHLLGANGFKVFMVSFEDKSPLWVLYDPCGRVKILGLEEILEELIFARRYLDYRAQKAVSKNRFYVGDNPFSARNDLCSEFNEMERRACLEKFQVLLEKTSFEAVVSGGGCLPLMKRRWNMLLGDKDKTLKRQTDKERFGDYLIGRLYRKDVHFTIC